VAVIENGVLQELIIERDQQKGLVGNIYKGKVCRVLPGMQAAFVDIGLERAAFLHLSDFSNKELEKKGSENIEHYLREGQAVVVQVTKDPLGSKGARLTTEISIPSRFQVYMPFANNSGVSQRIECDKERARLRACIEHFQKKNKQGGFIARTAAECIEEPVLFSDMTFLTKLWDAISEKISEADVKSLIHEDLSLSIRTLRDLYREGFERIRVDSKETYQKLVEFAKIFLPDIVPVIEHYTGNVRFLIFTM
jgi:ribonuclease G